VEYHRVDQTTESITFPDFITFYFQYLFSPPFLMETQFQEARIILAIEAIRSSKKLSRRSAAKLYKIPYTTLSDRITGRTSRCETKPNCHKFTNLEEEVLIRYILDLDTRGFAPRLANVEDMANHILQSRGNQHIGKNWAQ